MFVNSQRESKSFYENTNSLHERLQKCEAMAMDYERKIYCNEYGSKAATEMYKSKDLQGHWYKVIADGERSKARNMKILEKISALDKLVYSLGTKTERLEVLREEYINITRKFQSLGSELPFWENTPGQQLQMQNAAKSQLSQRWLESVTESGLGSSYTPLPSSRHNWTQTDLLCCPNCCSYLYGEPNPIGFAKSETKQLSESRAIMHLESMFNDDVRREQDLSNSKTSDDNFKTVKTVSEYMNDKIFVPIHNHFEPQRPVIMCNNNNNNVVVARHNAIVDSYNNVADSNNDVVDSNNDVVDSHERYVSAPTEKTVTNDQKVNYIYENQIIEPAEQQLVFHQSSLVKDKPVPEDSSSMPKPANQISGRSYFESENAANSLENDPNEKPSQYITYELTQSSPGQGNEENFMERSLQLSAHISSYNDLERNGRNELQQHKHDNKHIDDSLVKKNQIEDIHKDTWNSDNNNSIVTSPVRECPFSSSANIIEHPQKAQPVHQNAIMISPDSSFCYHQQLDLENKVFEESQENALEKGNFSSSLQNVSEVSGKENLEPDIVVDPIQSIHVPPVTADLMNDSSSNLTDINKNKLDDTPTAVSSQEDGSFNNVKIPENNPKVSYNELENKTGAPERNSSQIDAEVNDSSEESTCMDDVDDNFFDNDPPMMKESSAYRALLGIQAQHRDSDSEDDIENKFVQSVMSKESVKSIPSIITSHIEDTSSESSAGNHEIASHKNAGPHQKKEKDKFITAQEKNRIKQKVLLLGKDFDSDLDESVKSGENAPCDADDDFFD